MTKRTRFGMYGRQFILETLMPAIEDLTTADRVLGVQFLAIRFET